MIVQLPAARVVGSSQETFTGSSWDGYRVATTGDFNGDGLTDFYVHLSDAKGRINETDPAHTDDYVFLGKRSGDFEKVDLPGFSAGGINGADNYTDRRIAATGDFDGDGLTDIYVHKADDFGRSAGDVNDYIWFSDGNGTFTNKNASLSGDGSQTSGPREQFRIGATGDFDGDGRTDIYWYKADEQGRSTGNDSDRVWLSKDGRDFEQNIFGSSKGISGDAYKDYVPAAVGDFNGDGLTDIYWYLADDYLRTKAGDSPDRIWLSDGDGTFTTKKLDPDEGIPAGFDAFRIGAAADFNGDGLTDVLYFKADQKGRTRVNEPRYLFINKGDRTFKKIKTDDGFRDERFIYPGDFNGDGRVDLYTVKVDDDGRTVNNDNDRFLINIDGESFISDDLGPNAGVKSGGFDNRIIAASGDFNGDGKTDFFLHKADDDGRVTSANSSDLFYGEGEDPLFLTGIEDGFGVRTEVVYTPMSDDDVYTKGSASYPEYSVIGSHPLVFKVKTDDGIGGQVVREYEYEDLRYHVKKHGSLGFEKVTATVVDTGIVSETFYSHDYGAKTQGLVTKTRTIAPNGVELKETTFDWGIENRTSSTTDDTPLLFRYVELSTTKTRELNDDTLIAKVVTETTYDTTIGSPTEVIVTTTGDGDIHTTETDTVYGADNVADWLIGRPTGMTVTSKSPGVPDVVRKAAFTYDNDGFLLTETIEPGDPLEHIKSYVRNDFGVVTDVTETWGSTGTDGIVATNRTTSFAYDERSQFLLSETNPLSQSESFTYHPVRATRASATGPNGLTTLFHSDGFGRTEIELRADGIATRTGRYLCGGGMACPSGAKMVVITETDGAPTSKVYLDALGREVRNAVVALDGRESLVDTEYDDLGRVKKKSEPYFAGEAIYQTKTTYDDIGRVTSIDNPDGSFKTQAYAAREVTVTNELGQVQTTETDTLGRTVEVTDDLCNIATYAYDAVGRLIELTDQASNVTTMTYDIRGNKIAMDDPDKGYWTYRYNALGLLVEQTNARIQTTEIAYDVLGRMVERTDDVNGADEETATWVYDTAVMGVGKLTSSANPGYQKVAAYDGLGRPATTTETINGSIYTISTTYDAFSRPEDLVYPSGLTTRNVYGAYGHLAEVARPNGGAHYWKAVEQDARGNITSFELGNGVESTRVYDAETGRLASAYANFDTGTGIDVIQDLTYFFDEAGNLTQRNDPLQDLSEDFVYDALNRVITVTTMTGADPGDPNTHLIKPVAMWGIGPTTVVDVTYDALGNITSKTGVGAYTYGETHGACLTGAAGPHAVSSIAGNLADGEKNTQYCYDANGNMLSGDNRTSTWSAFDKPIEITKGAETVTVTYGPDRQRYKRIDAGASNAITHYVGGKLYEDITRDGVDERKHYIGNFAVVTEYDTAPLEHAYYLTDHLGSIDVITDGNGAVIERMSFDAWGKRRESGFVVGQPSTDGWVPILDPSGPASDWPTTTRGYTGHEQLDPVGLIHMNGRVYDPEIGRFMSADPIIQAPFNLQSFNRYSYVFNNPLSLVDPTGLYGENPYSPSGNSDGASGWGSGAWGSGSSSSTGSGPASGSGSSGSSPGAGFGSPSGAAGVAPSNSSAGGSSSTGSGPASGWGSSPGAGFGSPGGAAGGSTGSGPASGNSFGPPPVGAAGGGFIGQGSNTLTNNASIFAPPDLGTATTFGQDATVGPGPTTFTMARAAAGDIVIGGGYRPVNGLVGGLVAGAGAAVSAIATGILLLSTTETAPRRRDEVWNVVRGGIGRSKDFAAGTKLTSNGHGFSVQANPDLSVDQLAEGGQYPNKQISVTTVQELETIPGVTVVLNTPAGPRGGLNHSTVLVPNPPPEGIFDLIASKFRQQSNPHPAER